MHMRDKLDGKTSCLVLNNIPGQRAGDYDELQQVHDEEMKLFKLFGGGEHGGGGGLGDGGGLGGMWSLLLSLSLLAIFAIFIDASMHRHVHITPIISDIGSCWGFWFTPTLVITTAHCVKGACRVSVSNEVGVYFGVNRIIMHSAYDGDN
jgi:hypothetical protein